MDHKILTVLPILCCCFCVPTNLFWYFHREAYRETLLKINIPNAFILTFVVLLPTNQQQL